MDQTPTCRSCDTPLEGEAPDGLCPACRAAPIAPVPPTSERATVKSKPRHAAPTPEELAARFPQLEILESLGQGGMGAVYKARQKGLDRLVALKILPPAAGDEPGFAERFTREARALAMLSHPNIVAVHDSGEADGLYYLIMEFVDGPNLRRVISAGEAAPDQAMRIVAQMCDALQFAHDEGVIHRDIKPENVLLDRKGRVKIADFGLAKLLQQGGPSLTLTGTQQVMGTPHYMAPEQTERPLDVDHRADIYSLGVVLYEMLTGELPLGRFPLPSETAPVDARLDEIVLRTLEKAPEKRFQQASEIRSAVDSIAGTHPPATLTPASFVAAASAPGALSSLSSLHQEVHFPAMYERVRGSANLLFVTGLLTLVLHGVPALVFLILTLVEVTARGTSVNDAAMVAVTGNAWMAIVFTSFAAASIVMMLGAQRMKRLESRPVAVTGCVLALLPTAGACWLPLAVMSGFWALMVLNRRDVTTAFELKRAEMRAAGRRLYAGWVLLVLAIAWFAAIIWMANR